MCARSWGPNLQRCLESLVMQQTHRSFHFDRIFVVFNSMESYSDSQRSFERWTKSFERALPQIKTSLESRGGVSFARNKAFELAAEAGCMWVAFIDDDCHAAPDWLQTLTNSQAVTGDPVQAGETVLIPDGSPSPWVPDRLFGKAGYPTHSRIPGRENLLNTAYTRNVLVDLAKATSVIGRPKPFNEQFAQTGGEDIEFFQLLNVRGMRIRFVPDAIVFETYPHPRTTLRWWVLRGIRNGQLRLSLPGRAQGLPPFAETGKKTLLAASQVLFFPIVAIRWTLARRFRSSFGELAVTIAPLLGAVLFVLGIRRREYR